MPQISLNLIALGIFFLTFSVLLGPLLHIPPSLPAGLVFTILVVVTVDTLRWQGRGATLLLDRLASFSPQHRERVLRHEAGHFLVAHCLGIPVTGYTLTAWEAFRQGRPGFGGVEFESSVVSEAGGLWLDRFCIVWMAGIAAEQLFDGEVEGGGDDRQKLLEAMVLFGHSPQTATVKAQWAILQAKTLIQQHQEVYLALVNLMKERRSVAECYKILQSLPQS